MAGSAMAWEKGSVGRSQGGQFLEDLKSLALFSHSPGGPSLWPEADCDPREDRWASLKQKGFRGLCLRRQRETHLEFQEIHWSEVVPAPIEVRPTGLW